MVEDKKETRQLIDFRGYPSPQLELELSWQVGAKVDQQNIGMSVHIDIEVTENEIKNEKCVSCIMHNASCIKKCFQPPLPTF